MFDTSFSNWSVVGSGPLELFTKSSFIVFTSQPIFFNNSDATIFAAPPPTSTVTLGVPDTFPMSFTAASR